MLRLLTSSLYIGDSDKKLEQPTSSLLVARGYEYELWETCFSPRPQRPDNRVSSIEDGYLRLEFFESWEVLQTKLQQDSAKALFSRTHNPSLSFRSISFSLLTLSLISAADDRAHLHPLRLDSEGGNKTRKFLI